MYINIFNYNNIDINKRRKIRSSSKAKILISNVQYVLIHFCIMRKDKYLTSNNLTSASCI